MLTTLESVVRFVPDIDAAARWYATLLGGVGGTTVYWEVPDLDDALARLTAAGARLHRGPGLTSFGARVAMLIDPFGCTLGLNQSSDASRQALRPPA